MTQEEKDKLDEEFNLFVQREEQDFSKFAAIMG
jgi:hypothetical protein